MKYGEFSNQVELNALIKKIIGAAIEVHRHLDVYFIAIKSLRPSEPLRVSQCNS